MAAAVGMIGRSGTSCSWMQYRKDRKRNNGMINDNERSFRVRVSCVSSSSAVSDPYRTLRIRADANESEVKKAFRKLALQYHPDVCRGSDCGVRFHQINEAYHIVMSNLRGETNTQDMMFGSSTYEYDDADEPMRGMNDPDWELWEEWMGWEGAGIRDYSSHINPYI